MRISINTRQAYSEIDTFLSLLSEEKRNEIPQKLRNLFKQEKDKEYIKEIDASIPIKEQNLKDETLSIIAFLNLAYWCKDDEKKQRLKSIYYQNGLKYQETLRGMYNSNNIFKNTMPILENEKIKESDKNIQVVECKENIFKRFFNKIKSIFMKE